MQFIHYDVPGIDYCSAAKALLALEPAIRNGLSITTTIKRNIISSNFVIFMKKSFPQPSLLISKFD